MTRYDGRVLTRSRRLSTVIVATIFGSGAACTLFTSLDGLNDGPARDPNEAGDERTTPTADGGDAGRDAATDAEAGPSRYAAAVMSDAPLLYYRFGETGGAPARDEISGEITPYPVSGGKLGAAGALAGDSNTAIALDGTFRLQLTQEIDFAGLAPFTVEVWASPTTSTNGVSFIVDNELWGNRHGWLLSMDKDRVGFERWQLDGGSTSISAPQVAFDGAWHHVVASFDGTTRRIYVDSVRRADGPGGVPLAAIGIPWSVGNQNCACSSNGFVGGLDELAIYDKALTEERITAHFLAGR